MLSLPRFFLMSTTRAGLLGDLPSYYILRVSHISFIHGSFYQHF